MAEASRTCPRCGRVEPADAAFCYCGHIFRPEDIRTTGAVTPLAYASSPRGDTEPGPAVKTPFARQAARAAVAAPVVAYLIGCLGGRNAARDPTTATALVALNWSLLAFG